MHLTCSCLTLCCQILTRHVHPPVCSVECQSVEQRSSESRRRCLCHSPSLGTELHLVKTESEIQIQSSAAVVNLLFLPPLCSVLIYAALRSARKHVSFCPAAAVQEEAGTHGRKSPVTQAEQLTLVVVTSSLRLHQIDFLVWSTP